MNELTYVFIANKADFESLKNIVDCKLLDLDSSIMVLWDSSMESFFKESKVKYLLLDDYARKINLNSITKKVIEFIKTFPHIKILNNKSLVELLEYDKYSLWWFVRQGFYETCVNVVKEVYIIKSLINNKKINSILMSNQDKKFISIVKEAIGESKIKISFLNTSGPLEKNHLKNKKELILSYIPRAILVMHGLFRVSKFKPKSTKKSILLFTQSNVWTAIKGNIKGDRNSYTILRDMLKLEKYNKRYNVIPLDVSVNTDAAWSSIKGKKEPFLPYDYFLFRSFFDIRIQKNLKAQRSRLRELWGDIEKSPAFKKSMAFENINLYPILKPEIKSYFFNEFGSLIGAARNFEVGIKIIKRYNIRAIIAPDENGTSRFLVFAARSCNVPSLGLEHGVIHPINTPYIYSKKDLFSYNLNLNCVLPDKTAVFGKYFKKFLIKHGNYKPEMIAVTGQPRTDIIFENKGNYSKDKLCRELKIDSQKKIIVFASSSLRESITALSALVKSLHSLKDVNLIVKLHPKEDISLYKKVLSDLNYDGIVVKDFDLYNLLFCSDLVISISSTVMFEASIMNKPVIQINLLENYDFFGEAKRKVIPLVTNERELKKTIIRLLYGKSYNQRMEINRKKFIEEYFTAVDGKCTERFLEVLENLLTKIK